MKKLWQIGLILFFCLLASLLCATTNHTITIDGTNDFATDEDIAGNDGSTWYYSWDASNFYFGVVQGDIGGSPSATKWVQLYIDTDPQQSNPLSGNGTSTGVTYNTQTPTLAFNGDYHFRWKLNDSWWGLMQYSGSWAVVTFNGARARNTGINYVEFRIPWSDLGNPSRIRVCGLMMNEAGGSEWCWAAFPSGSFTAGYGNKVFTHFQSYVIISGVAPDYAGHLDTYPTASNVASGNWSAVGSWIGGAAPNASTAAYIQNGHTITLDGAGNVKYLRILSGGTYSGSSNTLNVAMDGRLDNSGTFTAGTGTVAFAGGNVVTGTVAFNNVNLAGGATFSASGASVINGTLNMNAGGYIAANSPTYGASSMLSYNSGGTYTAGYEWATNLESGIGVPNNVTMGNNTTVSFGTANQFRSARGSVNIPSGCGLTLSSASGGDLHLKGDFTRTGTFTPSGRAVEFNSTTVQQNIIGSPAFAYLTISNSSASGVVVAGDITVNNQLSIGASGKFSPASFTINMGAGSTFSNSGVFTPGMSTVSFAGAGTITGNTTFNNVTIANGAVNFGTNSTVNGTLLLNTGGGVSTNGPTFGPVSLLRYNTGGTFNASAEWYENVPSGQGVPQNVQISNNTSLRFGTAAFSRQASGNITIDAGSELRLSGTIGGDLRLKGDLINNGTFTPNGRAVTFNGSSAQQITNASFNSLYIDNPAGVSSLNDFGVDVLLSIQNNGVFNAGTRTITFGSLGNDGADLTVVSGSFNAGSGKCIFSGDTTTNPHTITGTISLYNVQLGGGMAQFISGVPIIVNELEIVGMGSIDLNNAPTFGVGSTLRYNTGGSYSAGNTWLKNVTSGPGVPWHVQISAGTQLDFGADTEPRTLLGDLNINPGAQFTLSSAMGGGIYIKGDWTNAGTFQCNGKAAHFNGSAQQNVIGGSIFNFIVIDNPAGVRFLIPQTIVNQMRIKQGGLVAASQSPNYQSGSALIFEAPAYTIGKEWADGTITQPGTPYQVFVNSGASVSFPSGGSWTLLDKLTIEGTFTAPNVALKPRGDLEIAVSASWNANGGTIMFEGGTTQNFIANKPIQLNNLYVNSFSTLVETVADDNIAVSGSLTNNNIIRKSQIISGAGAKTFGLAQAALNVTTQGGLTSVQVDRIDSTAPNATAATQPGKHWVITPTGGGYALNLTLPHNVGDHTKAYLARWNGSAWEYGRTSSTAGTVTLDGVAQLSTWAIAAPQPALDINGAASGVNYAATFTEDGGAVGVAAADAFITDPDSANMSGATVTIDATPDGADESLDANVGGTSIIKSYSAAMRKLTLSGADTKANYEQVLRSVVYNNLSQNPNTTNRTLTFIVTDDTSVQSVPVTTDLTIVAQNDAPVIAANTGMTLARGEIATITSAMLSATDSDNTAAQITFTATAGPDNGALRLNGSPTTTFTQDDINNNRVTYAHSGGYDPMDFFMFNVADGAGGSITGQTFTITLTPGSEVRDWKKIN